MKKLKRLFIIRNVARKANKHLSLVTLASAALCAANPAHAQTIVKDDFTSGSGYGTAIGHEGSDAAGLAPTLVNLPAENWQHISGAYYDGYAIHGNGNSTNTAFYGLTAAEFHNGAASGQALGAYNTGSLTLSAPVFFGEGSGPAGSNAVILLGFSSQLNSGSNYGPSPTQNFTGLAVTNTFGLQDYVNGVAVGSPLSFSGTYSATVPNGTPGTLLTYTLNTATGAISNVSFGNSTTAYSFATPSTFSSLYTANTEIGGTADSGSDTVAFSSFELDAASATAVPEPSTYALLAGGALMLGACQYRRRQAGA